MNPGLPQGFVRFGTAPHKILVFALEVGRITHTMVEQELGIERREIGINIFRLRKFGFLVRIGRIDGYEAGCRTQGVHMLPGPDAKPLKEFKNKTTAERTKKLRAKKAIKVPSVFQFRGVIKCTETTDQSSGHVKRRGKNRPTTTTTTTTTTAPVTPMPKPLLWKQPMKRD